jgi:hypothetical protein
MRAAWLLTIAMLGWAPAVDAQDEPPGSEVDPAEDGARERADALIAEGVALRRGGQEAEALDRFREAHALWPSPRSEGQMGLAAKSLRQYADAEKHLAAALAAADDPWVADNREALELAVAIVAKQLAWLDVSSPVDGAVLYVNGSLVGPLPLGEPLRVAAGPVLIEVHADGYHRASRETVVGAGATESVSLALDPLPVVQPETIVQPPPPPAKPDVVPEPASYTPWIITAGAVGGVGLAVGTALGIRTIQLKDERDTLCPSAACTSQRGVDTDEQARSMAIGSTVGFVVAGVGGASALVLWLLEPDDPPPVHAAIGASGAYMSTRWRF